MNLHFERAEHGRHCMKGKARVVLRVVAVSDAKVLVRLVNHFHGAITCLALYGVSLTEAGVLAISVQTFAGCLEKLRQGSTKTRIGYLRQR